MPLAGFLEEDFVPLKKKEALTAQAQQKRLWLGRGFDDLNKGGGCNVHSGLGR